MVQIKVIGGRGITVRGVVYRVGDVFTTDPFHASQLVKTGKYVIVPAVAQPKKEG